MDFRELEPDTTWDCDLCIVGAGPAGISIAREFLRNQAKVFLIESGGLSPNASTEHLAEGELTGLPYYPLERARARAFGGSSTVWTGACTPLEPIDFERRDWVPHSGWPIKFSDLKPYYERAQCLFEIGPFEYQPNYWESDGVSFLPLDSRYLTTCLWQNSPSTDFGVKYGSEIARSTNVNVLLHANATEIVTDERVAVATSIRVAGLDGKRATIEARFFVLSCGGIENPRLLLLSNRFQGAGLGNQHDLVGRFFMEHPHVSTASIHFRGSKRWLRSYRDLRRQGVKIRAGISVSETAQRSRKLVAHSAVLVNRYIRDDATHRQVSGFTSAKSIAEHVARGRLPKSLWFHLRNIVADLDTIAIGGSKHLLGRIDGIYTRSEQAPNPESRVMLSDKSDPLGLLQPRLEWRLTSLDKISCRVGVGLMVEEFERLGLGKIIPDEWLLTDEHSWPENLRGGFHHMGTTRMHDSPHSGVVDANCRVHSVANLYIAGSSVFPTSGYANPTLTIVALALRLADHLKSQMMDLHHYSDSADGRARAQDEQPLLSRAAKPTSRHHW